MNLRTLVLNSNYQVISLAPLLHIPAEDAITRCYNEVNPTCTVVSEYDIYVKHPTKNIKWPAIIARLDSSLVMNYVKLKPESIYYRDDCKCSYCGSFVLQKEMTIDHVIPTSRGGWHNWDNICLACKSCNYAKANKMPVGEWVPKNRLYKPDYWDILKNRKNHPITVYHESWIDYLSKWKGKIYVKKFS